MGATAYTELLAYILYHNGISASEQALPERISALNALVIPAEQLGNQNVTVANPLIYLTDGPISNSPRLQNLSPVTDNMLLNPPAGDWLNWRRTLDASGHSPLDQITKENVSNLQMAWGWSLPTGANMMTPIVHDGVLFAYSFGDAVSYTHLTLPTKA